MEQPMEACDKLERHSLPQKTTSILELGKTKDDVEEKPTLVKGRRCQDTRRERWREGTPGIETTHGGKRDIRQGKQDQGASGEVGKTGVQGEGETNRQEATQNHET